jgi:regulatory protein
VPDDLERCYIAAMRILNVRFNSEAELRRKLSGKKFERGVVESTLARLRKEKWLDDERFAAAFTRTRLGKRIGRTRVRRELAAAGVAEDVAARAVAENADPERERENLAAETEKKRRAIERRHGAEYAASPEGRRRLAAHLVKRGYDFVLVRSALDDGED